jgi:hypothetical protein
MKTMNDKNLISSQEFFKNTNYKIDEYNLANFFNVVDIGKNSYYNIAKTINFINIDRISPNAYMTYQVL